MDTDTHKEKSMWRHAEKRTRHNSRRDACPETNHFDTSILEFSLQNAETINFSHVSQSTVLYCGTAPSPAPSKPPQWARATC